ncbi:hypothetical protein V2W45_1338762 [Cenococcum geophilum]
MGSVNGLGVWYLERQLRHWHSSDWGCSGTGRFSYVIPPLEAIKARAKTCAITNNTILANSDGLASLAPSPLDVIATRRLHTLSQAMEYRRRGPYFLGS